MIAHRHSAAADLDDYVPCMRQIAKASTGEASAALSFRLPQSVLPISTCSFIGRNQPS